MEDVERSAWAFTQSDERSAVSVYLLVLFFPPFPLSCSGHSATPPAPFLSHCPFTSTICDVEAAIFLWRLPQLSPWRVTLMTNWVWKWRWWAVKAMPLRHPSPPTMYTKAARHTNTCISLVCVRHLTHNTLSHSALPWDKARGCVANRVTTWTYNIQRKENRKLKFWLSSTLTPKCVSLEPHLFTPQRYSIISNTALLSMNTFTHHSVFTQFTIFFPHLRFIPAHVEQIDFSTANRIVPTSSLWLLYYYFSNNLQTN